MENVNQYRVVKDYYDPEDKKTWDVKEWHDHEVFDDFQDAWAKMKRLKESGVLSFTDRWWISAELRPELCRYLARCLGALSGCN